MALLETTQQDYYQGTDHGNYQFISLEDIINQFVIAYVGEGKIISKVKRTDVSFFAQRALAELSFDTFKSCKSQEIEVPATLQMILPQDYVNYTKVSWVDSSGIKHPLYPTKHTSNPKPILQNDDGEYKLSAVGETTLNSKTVVLDGEYKRIQVGMVADNYNFHGNTTAIVKTVSHSGGITTITLGMSNSGSNASPAALLPFTSSFVTGTKFTFSFYFATDLNTAFLDNTDEDILLEADSFVLSNISCTQFQSILTQSPNTQVSDIKPGMTLAHPEFLPGTKVTDVAGDNIHVSSPALNALSSETVTFVSETNDSTTWSNYKSNTPSENNVDDYEDDTYWPWNGERYGLEPSHAQGNGTFYIDCNTGKIHFSSNVSGKTVVLDYISDTLGTEEEMKVHKFAEEAMYKWIMHAILSTRMNTPEYLVQRFKKEKFAETRKAKLRLSNVKLEEITQILRGKSKQIKH